MEYLSICGNKKNMKWHSYKEHTRMWLKMLSDSRKLNTKTLILKLLTNGNIIINIIIVLGNKKENYK